MFTNAEILTKVLIRFIGPALPAVSSAFLARSPRIANIESFLKQIGLVGPKWSLAADLSSAIGAIGADVALKPLILNFLQNVPDAFIPEMAHSIVDKGISIGRASLLDGLLELELEDLQTLKKYLDCNLPVKKAEDEYQLIEPEDEAESASGE